MLSPAHDGSSAAPRRGRRAKVAGLAGAVMVGAALLPSSTSGAATNPGLGTAGSFAVLATATVTNTGPTVVNGDLGLSPGTSITGFTTSTPPGPGVVNGTTSINDPVAAQAVADAETAFGALASQPCDVDLTGQDLGGLTLLPGVYCFSSSAQLTGDVTLDAEGDPAAVFVFRTGSMLTTASESSVLLVDEADACNVFWPVGSSATLGTDTDFAGTILAAVSITANTGASVAGRWLALEGATTLDTNVVNVPTCGGGTTTGGTDGGTTDGGTDTDAGTTGGTDTDAGTTTGGTDTDAGTTTGGTDTDAGTTTGGTDTDAGTTTGGTTGGTDTDAGTTGGTTDASTTDGSDAGATTGGMTTGGTTDGGAATGQSTGRGTPGGGITRQDLPRTGSEGAGSLALLGALAVVGGAAVVGVSRVRARPQHRR